MIEGGIEYSGYIDIKQPPKVKGRKLKVSIFFYLLYGTKYFNDVIIQLLLHVYFIAQYLLVIGNEKRKRKNSLLSIR